MADLAMFPNRPSQWQWIYVVIAVLYGAFDVSGSVESVSAAVFMAAIAWSVVAIWNRHHNKNAGKSLPGSEVPPE